MDSGRNRRALIVRGGWEGHSPVEATERFIPFLKEHGYAVEVHESAEVYADGEKLAATDLVVQCYTQGVATGEQVLGLSAAVAGGTGLAGWHGGICDSFRASPDYLHLTGGQWAAHPGGFVEHEVAVVPDRRGHRIVEGLDRWKLNTEQYWVLTDELNDVLATTTFGVGDDTPWREELTCPAVWTRQWGKGRVFVSTIGHKLEDLDHPDVRTLTERGLLWASR
ncbi:ThuA domain-containing protein [Nonomuraea sp. KC401]|uniref:ThuA domain-containing protein n=1 Tax=unclassified Nonomuraea TaxID=2593643 RepID=UPI0010FE9601|nr:MULTISPECIES: ThuA domain-containing protein [unclassified Nonomuraea]NBE93903.1 ThuA domain-containing protein [Nonomuraea sp. K271]TLF62113.1 ThuA domain-containing protein [Nonomuraea sp. KC401]